MTAVATDPRCLLARQALARRQQPDVVPFQDGASKSPGQESTGIDIDPVAENFWIARRAVAMHHDFSKILVAREKLVADPQQVVLTLLQKRDAGSYAGVAQKIAADRQRGSERAEKLGVGIRKRRAKGRRRRLIISASHQRSDIYAVGVQRLEAAETAPIIGNRWVHEKTVEYGFVVALQRYKPRRKGIARQTLDDPLRGWAAVNIIAQRHGKAICDRSGFQIASDHFDHPIEEIRSSVDVPDNIEPIERGRYCYHGGLIIE